MSFVMLCVFVSHSPFEVLVGAEAGVQKVRAWGPGLKTGMVGKSADFVVEAIGTDVGTLGEPRARGDNSWIRKYGMLTVGFLAPRFLHRRPITGQDRMR